MPNKPLCHLMTSHKITQGGRVGGSQKERRVVFRFWLFKYILWPQWFAYELSLLQVYARRHVFLLSIYRSILILFSVNYG